MSSQIVCNCNKSIVQTQMCSPSLICWHWLSKYREKSPVPVMAQFCRWTPVAPICFQNINSCAFMMSSIRYCAVPITDDCSDVVSMHVSYHNGIATNPFWVCSSTSLGLSDIIVSCCLYNRNWSIVSWWLSWLVLVLHTTALLYVAGAAHQYCGVYHH